MSEVVALIGEIVTCENGHAIARVKEHIFGRDRVRSSAFQPLRSDLTFEPGAAVKPCPECGGRYIRANGGGMQLHVGGKWRSRRAAA